MTANGLEQFLNLTTIEITALVWPFFCIFSLHGAVYMSTFFCYIFCFTF